MKESNSIETIDYDKFRMVESIENFVRYIDMIFNAMNLFT